MSSVAPAISNRNAGRVAKITSTRRRGNAAILHLLPERRWAKRHIVIQDVQIAVFAALTVLIERSASRSRN